MDAQSIPTLPMGEMDYDALAVALEANKHRPAIINVNIGTIYIYITTEQPRLNRFMNTFTSNNPDNPDNRIHSYDNRRYHCERSRRQLGQDIKNFKKYRLYS